MPLCTSCGKEVAPGKKFCENCGAPVEQSATAPAVPPAVTVVPASLPSAPVKPAGGSGKTFLIAGIIVLLAVIAGVYFVGLPMISGTQNPGTGLLQTPAIPSQVPVTPAPEMASIPVTTITPVSLQTYEDKYTESYNLVHSFNHGFIGGQKEVFTQDLTRPPLYIKFDIVPKMYYGEKTVDIGLHSERVVNTSYPSPNAWFKVNVYDASNGGLVDEQGFNKGYGVTTKQEFMVRTPGNYRVEMTGNDVTADVRILVGKT